MALPKFLQSYLPSYNISQMKLYDPYDKKLIIEAVLNQGDMEKIKWLFRTYNLREVKAVLKNPRRGCWDARALNYWTRIFDIKLPKLMYEVAIMSLEPRPELMERYFKYLRSKVDPETKKRWEEIERLRQAV